MEGATRSHRSYACSTPTASAAVVVSGTVGSVMASSGSPATSETVRFTIAAPCSAAASRPPFRRDTCLRTVLTSRIAAPERSSSRCRSRFSSNPTPSAGRHASAELPPVKQASTTSSGPTLPARRIRRAAARRLAWVGSGWPPASRSMRRSVPACPDGAITTPPAIVSPSTSSSVAAIRALALPAPSTSTRPPRPGRCSTPSTTTEPASPARTARRTAAAGSAAQRPASTTSSTSSRSPAGPRATSPSRFVRTPEPTALMRGRSASRRAESDRRPPAQLLGDPKQGVVLGGALAADGGPGLDVAGVQRHRQVGDDRVLGLARALRHDHAVAVSERLVGRVERLGQRADLVHLPQQRVGGAGLDSPLQAGGVRDEQVVPDDLDPAGLGQLREPFEVVLVQRVLDRDDAVARDQAQVQVDHARAVVPPAGDVVRLVRGS